MRSICLYFQVHQPFRLRTYRFFDMGVDHYYYDDYLNRSIIQRIAQKCYLPANDLMLRLIKKHGKKFSIAYSISGTALDQFEKFAPEVLKSFQELAKTGSVEFLTETYAHSLSSLRSKEEFSRQVEQHSKRMEELFGQKPVTFRNTELIYSDTIGEWVHDMGYKGMLTEGAKHVLGWRSPNFLYHADGNPEMKLLLKNFRLSDDIAFRFSNRGWSEWPLTADRYAGWLRDMDPEQEVVNIFIDYETFGEHQWADTGIFEFMEALPGQVIKTAGFQFKTPSEVIGKLKPVGGISVPYPISWADAERDVTAWLGNDMQNEAFDKLYQVESRMAGCTEPAILKDWSYLQTSDHFYYMSTKWFSDGDVHRYFTPYPSPYEAFINYMNVLSDFLARVDEHCKITGSFQEKARTFAGDMKDKASGAAREGKKKAKEKWDDVKDYTLEDIARMSDAKIKELVKKVDLNELAHAIQNVSDEVRDRVIPNMTKKMKAEYEILESKVKKLKKTDLKKFRERIEEELRGLWGK
jgi:alpha-amylase